MFVKETSQDTFFLKKKSINCGGKILKLDEPLVMGVLNLTPDSFFDGGKYQNEASIVNEVQNQINYGAKIIDIGGYSSKPNAKEVSEKEELNRVIPIIQLLKQEFNEIIISIDTFRSKVAEKAIKNGAFIVNDISSGEMDNKMIETIAELKVPYVMMHMQGTPQTMQQNPKYGQVTFEVMDYFKIKIDTCIKKGINDLIIDPGFGFGKTIEHNYKLLKDLNQFQWFGLPILVGFSRKSMIYKPLEITTKDALNGTTALNAFALTKGADILRVHDVKAANEVILLFNLMNKSN